MLETTKPIVKFHMLTSVFLLQVQVDLYICFDMILVYMWYIQSPPPQKI